MHRKGRAYFDVRGDAEARGTSGAYGSENDFHRMIVIVLLLRHVQFLSSISSGDADIRFTFCYDLFHDFVHATIRLIKITSQSFTNSLLFALPAQDQLPKESFSSLSGSSYSCHFAGLKMTTVLLVLVITNLMMAHKFKTLSRMVILSKKKNSYSLD